MNRRKFLGMMVGGVAAGAAMRTWPFRAYSFPKAHILTPQDVNATGFGFNIPNSAHVTGMHFELTEHIPIDVNGCIDVDREIIRIVHIKNGVLTVQSGVHTRVEGVTVR